MYWSFPFSIPQLKSVFDIFYLQLLCFLILRKLINCRFKTDVIGIHIFLHNSLSVTVIYPFFGSICRNNHQRNALIIGFCNGRIVVQHCRTRSANNANRFFELLCHSHCEKSRRTFIVNNNCIHFWMLVNGNHKRCISRTWRTDNIFHSMQKALIYE